MLGSSSYSFVGVRTREVDAMSEFVGGVLGYELIHEQTGFRAYRTPAGQRFEIFGEDYPGKEHFTTGPVVGFEVDDFDAAVTWLEDNNIEVHGGVVTSQSGTQWAHFRAPDGNIYEFVKHADL